jgi:hypothetical protein
MKLIVGLLKQSFALVILQKLILWVTLTFFITASQLIFQNDWLNIAFNTVGKQ